MGYSRKGKKAGNSLFLKEGENDGMTKRIMIVTAAVIVCCSVSVFAENLTLSYGTPEEAGMSPALLTEAARIYEEAAAHDDVRGAVLLVARGGKIVLHKAVSWRNKEDGLPMEKETMFRMASNTKPVIATAIAILAEEKKLAVTDVVRKHIPSFDNYRSGFITIRHLLSHTSGFRIDVIFYEPFLPASDNYPDAPSLRAEVDRFGETGAEVVPGTSYSYSNPGYNTLGALIEITSGKPVEAFLKEKIYEPLGMRDSYHHEVAEKLDGKLNRMSVVYKKKDEKWYPSWKPGDKPDYPFVRASGGMISTAFDYAVFCRMFLNKGIYAGRRILSEESVAMMTSPQTMHLYSEKELEKRNEFYGFGWVVSKDGVFSHGGSDGTFAWVDPVRDIIGIIFTQSPGGNNPSARFIELVNAAVLE